MPFVSRFVRMWLILDFSTSNFVEIISRTSLYGFVRRVLQKSVHIQLVVCRVHDDCGVFFIIREDYDVFILLSLLSACNSFIGIFRLGSLYQYCKWYLLSDWCPEKWRILGLSLELQVWYHPVFVGYVVNKPVFRSCSYTGDGEIVGLLQKLFFGSRLTFH